MASTMCPGLVCLSHCLIRCPKQVWLTNFRLTHVWFWSIKGYFHGNYRVVPFHDKSIQGYSRSFPVILGSCLSYFQGHPRSFQSHSMVIPKSFQGHSRVTKLRTKSVKSNNKSTKGCKEWWKFLTVILGSWQLSEQ